MEKKVIIKSTRTNKLAKCRMCGYPHEAATSLEGKKPTEGNLSICYGCNEVGKFDKDLNVLPLTFDDKQEIMKDPQLWQEIRSIQNVLKVKKQNGKSN